MQLLRANTEVIVRIGPFVDVGDGFTPQTDITLAGDEAELLKAASVEVDLSSNTWAAATGCRGWYDLTLSTTDTNTEGTLAVVVQDDSDCLPVVVYFMVMAEAAWDSMFVAKDTGYMDVNIKAISEDTTAPDNLELMYDGTGYAGGTIKLQSDLTQILAHTLTDTGTQLADAFQKFFDVATPTGTINSLPDAAPGAAGGLPVSAAGSLAMDTLADWVDGGRLDALLDAIPTTVPDAAGTAATPAEVATALENIHLDHLLAVEYDPASKPGVATALLNELVESDAGVSRLTENALEQAPSGTGASAATIADAVWDEAIASHNTGTTFGGKNQKVVPSETIADYKAVGFSTHAAADVWAVVARTLTANTNLNDITAADVKTAIEVAGSHLTLIKAQTDDLADGARLDLLIDAIKAITDALPNAGALTDLATAIDGVPTTAEFEARTLSTEATVKLEASAGSIVVAAAAAGTLSNIAMTTTLTEITDDHYNGRIIIWTSGVLQNQATNITDYNGATKMLTYTAVTEAPTAADSFVIV